MSRPSSQYEHMSLDDFEELLADKPANEKWELIGGRVVRMMIGARWEHNYMIQSLSNGLRERLRANRSSCRTLIESFRLRDAPSILDGLEAELDLPAIGVSVPLAEVYLDIVGG